MNGQLGLWTAGMVAIAWFLAAVTVQSLSARRWWWLLGETGLAVLAYDWGWWGLERLRFRWTTADGEGLLLAAVVSMGAIAIFVLVLSQVMLPGLLWMSRRSPRHQLNPTEPAGENTEPSERAPGPPPNLPRRRRWELCVQALLVTVANIAWGGALGLYAPP